MTDQLQDMIKEIAVKHGVALGRNDPILILYTMNEALNSANEAAQIKLLETFKSEIEGVVQRWGDDAKDKAERTLNAAFTAGKTAMGSGMREVVDAAEKSILSAVNAAIEKFDQRIEKAVNLSRWFTILNLAAAAVVITAAAIIF